MEKKRNNVDDFSLGLVEDDVGKLLDNRSPRILRNGLKRIWTRGNCLETFFHAFEENVAESGRLFLVLGVGLLYVPFCRRQHDDRFTPCHRESLA